MIEPEQRSAGVEPGEHVGRGLVLDDDVDVLDPGRDLGRERIESLRDEVLEIDVLRHAHLHSPIVELDQAIVLDVAGYGRAMPSGRAGSFDELPQRVQSLLDTESRGVMSTISADGSPHSVPVVFAVVGNEIISPIDHKPKSGVVMARVRNLGRDDRVTLLIDHYVDEWERLAWLMVRGTAIVDEDAPMPMMLALNRRYPQYAPDERHDALIRITPTKLSWWSWT